MEQVHSKSSEEQYVGTKFIKECLDVSRTKSYEIAREIEDTCPSAVIRLGRCLRVRKKTFFLWIDEHSAGDEETPYTP
jgi:hypothetical protein